MRLLAALNSLSGSHRSKQQSLLSRRRCRRCRCRWSVIPLLSSVLGSTQAFVPNADRIAPTFRSFHSSSTSSHLFVDSRQELERLRVVDLKDKLRERGLKVGGVKAELINRLLLLPEAEEAAMPRRSPRKAAPVAPAKVVEDGMEQEEEEEQQEKPKKRARKTKAKTDGDDSAKKKSPKKKAKQPEQRITEVDDIPKLWNEEMAKQNASYTFKIVSWNVAGLRAFVKKQPETLQKLVLDHDIDLLCLQETKLQEMHLDDPKMNFRGLLEEQGYKDYWSCSTEKKGYSGTAVFIKDRKENNNKKATQASIDSFFSAKKSKDPPKSDGKESDTMLPVSTELLMPTSVTYDLGKPIDNEGRTIIMEYPWATVTNVYVPNSGQTLQRLDYRTKEWDKFFLEFQKEKQQDRKKPVIWLGDLNIAHKAFDVWNDGAKHHVKQAGVTPQERESFTEQLEDGGFIDAFRQLHPEAKGHYSYWSQRSGARPVNKGLRLDYFICSPQLFEEGKEVVVRDSYMLHDYHGSDHGPVVLELEIKELAIE